jgi:CheY-like chemotaxis protein
MPNGAPMFQYPVNGLDQQQQQQQQHPNQLLAPPAGMQFSSGGMTAFPGLPPPHQQLVIPQQPSGALVMQSNEQPGSTAVSPPTGNSQTETPKASKGKKRKMRDPKAPKPARYAWNFFFKKEYTRMREKENSDSLDVQQAFTDLTEQVGRKWKSLPPKARAPYVALALEDKRRYEQELAAYNGTPAEELKVPSRTSNFESFASSRAAFGLSIDGIGRRDGGAEGADGEKPKYTWEPQCSADVLVCDDDMAFQLMLKRKLRKAYYKRGKEPTIETATNGEEMLELMLKAGRSYAMVTLDSEMGMANMTGIETIRMLRKANYTGLVVGITAFGDEEHYKAFMDGGVDAVLCKGSKDMFKTLSTLIGDDMTVASSSTDEGSSSTLIAAAAIAREASEVSETDVVKKAEPKAAVTTTPTPTAKETETKAAT